MADPVDILAFAADARTERTLRQGLKERASARVRRGKLAEALQVLPTIPSSKLVLVDLDREAEPEAACARLQAVCPFGTEFVALGSINTTGHAHSLLRTGFADYLVKPLAIADVRTACAALLDELPEREYAGHVVGFVGNGGSGVSTLVAAVARASRARGLNCIILSFDPLFPEAFGLEPAGNVSDMLLRLGDGKFLEFGPFDDQAEGGAQNIALVGYPRAESLPVLPSVETAQSLVTHLANRASMVLLCGIPDPELLTALMNRCDVQVVLYEPTLVSINVAVRCLVLLEPEDPPVLVQSNRRVPRSSLSTAQIRYALGDREPVARLPYDAQLHSEIASTDAEPRAGRRYRKALAQVVDVIFERIG